LRLLPNTIAPRLPRHAQLTQLQREMSKLAGMVSDIAKNNNRPQVLHLGGNNRGWSAIILPGMAGGAVLYLYCRITGTSILDFFYVSRSGLASFRNTVQESMTKMWEEMRKQKDEVIKMVTHLGRKQDDLKDSQDQLMAKQDQMDDRLRRVGAATCCLVALLVAAGAPLRDWVPRTLPALALVLPRGRRSQPHAPRPCACTVHALHAPAHVPVTK
jgi:hypothetical protein